MSTGPGRWLKRAASFLVHGGAWTLRAYEARILQAAGEALGAADAATLRGQLAELEHLKREHADRMVTFYFFGREQLPLLSRRGEAQCVAAFRIQPSAGGAALRAGVFAHRGVLSSLEFSRGPGVIANDPAFTMKPAAVKGAGAAEEIDREEHG